MHRVVPIYLAINTSPSMARRLVEVEQMLVALTDELLSSPVLGDQVRIGVVSFADTADLVLPLTDLTRLGRMPRIPSGRETRFGPLFELLAKVVGRDLTVHRAMDAEVMRPMVFLLCDGLPTDNGWERSFAKFYGVAHAGVILATIGLDEKETQWLGSALRATAAFSWADERTYSLAARVEEVLLDHASILVTSRVISTPRGSSSGSPSPEQDA
ncbi:hypothetical protein DQ384_24180 [Sphaerisporangium album]|uniref:VWA domain-containing protein n=1 Tax=Sphaerisporangium album TaxID=509200 RepID=A0A367FCX7_9ACTN|nr:hypothetical protein [Sphaerisporangium album]RCG28233.1 hypothetical protein DQ384_24180 [Sphaerisporangium album]